MARILVLFLDGVGLGSEDPKLNPMAAASMPTIRELLNGLPLVATSSPQENKLASLLALDAQLGVPGLPQSASGQAALLTGRNVPAEIGEHYGPKPNAAVAAILRENNLFMEVTRRGESAALLNAYPPRYFEAIESKLRLYSAIPMAVNAAAIPLMNFEDLQHGLALSADFIGRGWNTQSDFPAAPEYTPQEAGRLFGKVAQTYTLSWFDYWLSDYAGHRGTFEEAVNLLETLDAVLGGLIEIWDLENDLLILTSDHGNLENLNVKGHTANPVPALLIGSLKMRQAFSAGASDLTDFFPGVLNALFDGA
ncbi:MAG: hypothetical protein IIC78_05575 [Chloroflexi bacterium]|nr:hypothetical protein [Chloroflexota bacterium]